jgi:putative transposase
MDSYLTTSILEDAIEKYGKPEIFNADQGSQYTIVIERFLRTLKYENIYLKGYNTIKEAREGINQCIEIYNSQKIYSSIGYKTPDIVWLLLKIIHLCYNNK